MNNKYDELINNSAFFKNFIKEHKPEILNNTANAIKLNIGAGPNVFPFPGWTNFDREDISPYFEFIKNKSDISDLPGHVQILSKYLKNNGDINCKQYDFLNGFPQYQDNTVDCIYIGQVIEHINPIMEAPKVMKECFRILKPGGVLRMTTPDLDLLIEAYLNNQMDRFNDEQPTFYKDMDVSGKLAMLMFGSCGPKSTWNYYEGHMFLYTQNSMNDLLKGAGYKDIEYYYETGKSKSKILEKESVDLGMSHSFIVEAVK